MIIPDDENNIIVTIKIFVRRRRKIREISAGE